MASEGVDTVLLNELLLPKTINSMAYNPLQVDVNGGNRGTGEIQVGRDDQFPLNPNPPVDSSPLELLGYGTTHRTIFFWPVKFTGVAVYVNPGIVSYVQQWKGRSGPEIQADDHFFYTLCDAPVEKFIGVIVIRELPGERYGLHIKLMDHLNAIYNKFQLMTHVVEIKPEEINALLKLIEFFRTKYLKKNSRITYHFSAFEKTVEVAFVSDGKVGIELAKTVVENENVVDIIMKYYLGGSSAISQSTITTLADKMADLLKQ